MIHPTSNNLIVTRYELPEQSPGGIIIPEAHRTDGTGWLWVIAVRGDGRVSRKGVLVPIDPDLQPGVIVESESQFAATATDVLDEAGRMQYTLNEAQISHIRND